MKGVRLPGAWGVDDVPRAAVFLCRGAVQLHAGLYFRDSRIVRRLHLAFHHLLELDAPEPASDAFVEPGLDPLHLQQVAAECRRIARNQPDVPYAFGYALTKFEDGEYRAGPGEHGLSCATFVLAVFESVGLTLVDVDSWRPREGDEAAMRALVALLERHGYDAQATLVNGEIGEAVVRFRPEEVAAATLGDGSAPVRFAHAACAGAALASVLADAGMAE